MNPVQSYDETALSKMYLPIGEMLQISRVNQIDDGTIIGEKDLSERDWIFALHFPGDPIFPGSLLIEGAGQLIAVWGWHSGLRGKPRLVKVSAEFKSPVSAFDQLIRYTGTMSKRKNIIIGSVEITVRERYIGRVHGSIVVV
jgi:3-hydroxymyristoyl/3-hydroxydecanoyl-(acyl carrier protein) dehydratase